MTDQFIVFGAPDIRQAEVDDVVESLNSGWLGTGPKVHKFEGDFAKYKDVQEDRVAALHLHGVRWRDTRTARGRGHGHG